MFGKPKFSSKIPRLRPNKDKPVSIHRKLSAPIINKERYSNRISNRRSQCSLDSISQSLDDVCACKEKSEESNDKCAIKSDRRSYESLPERHKSYKPDRKYYKKYGVPKAETRRRKTKKLKRQRSNISEDLCSYESNDNSKEQVSSRSGKRRKHNPTSISQTSLIDEDGCTCGEDSNSQSSNIGVLRKSHRGEKLVKHSRSYESIKSNRRRKDKHSLRHKRMGRNSSNRRSHRKHRSHRKINDDACSCGSKRENKYAGQAKHKSHLIPYGDDISICESQLENPSQVLTSPTKQDDDSTTESLLIASRDEIDDKKSDDEDASKHDKLAKKDESVKPESHETAIESLEKGKINFNLNFFILLNTFFFYFNLQVVKHLKNLKNLKNQKNQILAKTT